MNNKIKRDLSTQGTFYMKQVEDMNDEHHQITD